MRAYPIRALGNLALLDNIRRLVAKCSPQNVRTLGMAFELEVSAAYIQLDHLSRIFSALIDYSRASIRVIRSGVEHRRNCNKFREDPSLGNIRQQTGILVLLLFDNASSLWLKLIRNLVESLLKDC